MERMERVRPHRGRAFAHATLRRINRVSSVLLCLWAMVAVVGMFVPAHYGLRADIKLIFGVVLPVADMAMRLGRMAMSLRP